MSIKITGESAIKGKGKYHTPVPNYLADIVERYSCNGKVKASDIRDADIEFLLEAYAKDITMDVLNIAESLNISKSTLYRILRDEHFAPLYEAAKARRSQLAFNTGYQALLETYEGAKEQTVSREQVNASRNLANYMLEYSKLVNPENIEKKDNESKSVNITLALPSSPHFVDCEVNTDDES